MSTHPINLPLLDGYKMHMKCNRSIGGTDTLSVNVSPVISQSYFRPIQAHETKLHITLRIALQF